jgi:hypothetical protein
MKIDDLDKMSKPEIDHLRDKIKTMPCVVCGGKAENFKEFEVEGNFAFVTLCKDHLTVGLDALKAALQIEMASTMTPAGRKTLR